MGNDMSDIWQLVVRSLQEYWQQTLSGSLAPLIANFVATLLIAAVTLMVARLVSRGTERAMREASHDPVLALLAGRLAHLAVSGLGAGWALSLWGVPWPALAGFFGFFGLGLSVSLADVVKSAIAGAYLLIERPYWVGDTVKVRDFEGVVEDIRLRTTVLVVPDGRKALLPNYIMLTEAIVKGPVAAIPGK